MRKQKFVVCAALLGLLAIAGAFGQEGFTGPSNAANGPTQQGGFTGPGSVPAGRGQGELVTAVAARDLRDDSRVTLQGTIVSQLSRENFLFQDSSGEITVEIDRKVWRGLEVGENDRVEIYGEVDRERRGTQVDVKSIKKL